MEFLTEDQNNFLSTTDKQITDVVKFKAAAKIAFTKE